MSLSYDLVTARDICVELELLCKTNGVEYASALLAALGKDNWEKMLTENQEEFFAFVRSTPSQRKRKASWKDSKMQTALAIGGLLFARQAVEYLEIAVVLEDLYSITSREAVSKVAEIAVEQRGATYHLWPFDGDNPF